MPEFAHDLLTPQSNAHPIKWGPFGAKIAAPIAQNALHQLQYFQTHPTVAIGLTEKYVELNDWVCGIKRGKTIAFDGEKNAFRCADERHTNTVVQHTVGSHVHISQARP